MIEPNLINLSIAALIIIGICLFINYFDKIKEKFENKDIKYKFSGKKVVN